MVTAFLNSLLILFLLVALILIFTMCCSFHLYFGTPVALAIRYTYIITIKLYAQYIVRTNIRGVDISVKLNLKIQHLVSESGKTANQISKETGINHTSLYRLMDGTNKDMRLSTAFKLANALGVDINEFKEEPK